MGNENQPKDHVIDEIKSLRNRINELETKISSLDMKKKGECRNDPRENLDAEIEFIGDFDIVKASGINISKGGICFEISESLPFSIRFKEGGQTHDFRGNLVWMDRLPGRKYRFGFSFAAPESGTPI
jgi:hypothetical protein